MKKFGLFILGFIAAIVLLANLGPMLGLAISLGLLYLVVKQFLKAEASSGKIIWAILGFIILAITIANLPAIIGIVAAYVLYVIYKNWNSKKENEIESESESQSDPFTHFEKQWAELKNY
jgi:lia operon protein LiaI